MASSQASAFGLKDSSLIKMQGFIDGKWRDAKDGGKIGTIKFPTNEELGTGPEMGPAKTKELSRQSKTLPT
ncbi:hypothetical protein MPER_05188 [Moniliophthora perniciosa FA553]|nr:hypothetical protein MPER_05188 [Moniliophthora perniciosa FA553]